MKITTFDSESLFGYTQQTTFWQDFCIAEAFGETAIKDTYNRAIKEWARDKVYMTELVLVLNWKCWYFYETGNEKYSDLYSDLYYKARDIALDTFKGDDLEYFLRTTD